MSLGTESRPPFAVSRETQIRLEKFHPTFLFWQKRINLVSPRTVGEFWTRHVADSLQLLQFAPEAALWVDMGSGGGFPGLVVAAVRTEQPGQRTILVESNGKKAAFLRESARIAEIRAEIRSERLETVLPALSQPVSVISARALAPLAQLVAWTEELLKTGSLGLYLKGRDATSEVEAMDCPPFLKVAQFQSQIDPAGVVVAVWNPDKCPGPRDVAALAKTGDG